MMKENTRKRGRPLGRLNLTDKDVAKISQWIEDDAVTQDMYQERLDQMLDLGRQSDKDALAGAGLTRRGPGADEHLERPGPRRRSSGRRRSRKPTKPSAERTRRRRSFDDHEKKKWRIKERCGRRETIIYHSNNAAEWAMWAVAKSCPVAPGVVARHSAFTENDHPSSCLCVSVVQTLADWSIFPAGHRHGFIQEQGRASDRARDEDPRRDAVHRASRSASRRSSPRTSSRTPSTPGRSATTASTSSSARAEEDGGRQEDARAATAVDQERDADPAAGRGEPAVRRVDGPDGPRDRPDVQRDGPDQDAGPVGEAPSPRPAAWRSRWTSSSTRWSRPPSPARPAGRKEELVSDEEIDRMISGRRAGRGKTGTGQARRTGERNRQGTGGDEAERLAARPARVLYAKGKDTDGPTVLRMPDPAPPLRYELLATDPSSAARLGRVDHAARGVRHARRSCPSARRGRSRASCPTTSPRPGRRSSSPTPIT